MKYLEIVPLVAAELVKKGDFLAPSYPNKKYGYGCILYDHFCSTAFTGAFHVLHKSTEALREALCIPSAA